MTSFTINSVYRLCITIYVTVHIAALLTTYLGSQWGLVDDKCRMYLFILSLDGESCCMTFRCPLTYTDPLRSIEYEKETLEFGYCPRALAALF